MVLLAVAIFKKYAISFNSNSCWLERGQEKMLQEVQTFYLLLNHM